MAAPDPSLLDLQQILQRVYDEATGKLRTTAEATIVNADIAVDIDSVTDSIAIKDSTGTKELKINVNGSTDTNVITSVLPTGASTSALQTSGNASLVSIDSKLTSPLTVNLGTIDGVSTEATLALIKAKTDNLDAAISTLATKAQLPAVLGTQTVATSLGINLASDQYNDLYVVGQSAQTAVINNILTVVSGASATDLTGYRSAVVQVISTGTGGTFIFEGSNDNVNFISTVVYNQFTLTGTPINAAITATPSVLAYTFPLTFRYNRLRIATLITGGTIQAFSKFSQTSWAPAVNQVSQSVATNLNMTLGAVIANVGVPVLNATAQIDVASAAITTTTTSSAIQSPTTGSSYSWNIPVTVVSGTNPTLDLSIEESDDTATNWFPIYQFPRITTTGIYRTPRLAVQGNRYRYVQTISGTTPSFTRSINRLSHSAEGLYLKQIFDRTIAINTLGSTSAILYSEGLTNLQLSIVCGVITGAVPRIQLQGSDDGTSWYALSADLDAVSSATSTIFTTDFQSKFVRAIVTKLNASSNFSYVLIKGFK